MSQFRNLVFEGGGVKGIAYSGALEVLDERGILPDIQRVAGTSAGAITAALLALGASAQDIGRIVGATDFRRFMDHSWLVGDTLRLVRSFGWYKGEAFTAWVRQQITDLAEGQTDLTFGQLARLAKIPRRVTGSETSPGGPRYRQLFVVASDLSAGRAKTCSAEETPDMPIWLGVRMSMSIPLFFTAVRRDGSVIVDGGVTWNYPIDLFDDLRFLFATDPSTADPQVVAGVADPRIYVVPDYPTTYRSSQVYNKQTLGFRVDTSDEIKAEKDAWNAPLKPIHNLYQHGGALVSFLLDQANKVHLHTNDWHRTVFIEANGVRFTDFNLPQEKIDMLVANGRRCTQAYFAWFDNPALPQDKRPVNRVDSHSDGPVATPATPD